MMTLNLNGEVNNEMLDKIVEYLNANTELVIYFCSNGGDIYSMQVIIKLLSDNADRVTLIGYGELFSAAFNIFFESTCKKELLPYTIGMTHLSYANLLIDESKKPKGKYHTMTLSALEQGYAVSEAFYKQIGLTKKELKTVMEGEDLYLSPKRMEELWLRNR